MTGRDDPPAWVPIDLAVHATDAPAGTIRAWASLNRIRSRHHDGRTEYHLADLMQANATRRPRQRRTA